MHILSYSHAYDEKIVFSIAMASLVLKKAAIGTNMPVQRMSIRLQLWSEVRYDLWEKALVFLVELVANYANYALDSSCTIPSSRSSTTS